MCQLTQKENFAHFLPQIILILVLLGATTGKSLGHQLQWQGPVREGGSNIVAHSCIHDQIIEQRTRTGHKVYSVTPQLYKESDISKPLNHKGRELLGVSNFLEQLKDAKQPIRIYLNYDAVGHSPERDCRRVGDIVKVSVNVRSACCMHCACMSSLCWLAFCISVSSTCFFDQVGEPPVTSLPDSTSCNPHGDPPIFGDCWYNCTLDDISGEDKTSRLRKV